MLILFKLWAAMNCRGTWNAEMEKFINSRNLKTNEDLERAIRDYEATFGI